MVPFYSQEQLYAAIIILMEAIVSPLMEANFPPLASMQPRHIVNTEDNVQNLAMPNRRFTVYAISNRIYTSRVESPLRSVLNLGILICFHVYSLLRFESVPRDATPSITFHAFLNTTRTSYGINNESPCLCLCI